jgi:voltage-gated potassium channel
MYSGIRLFKTAFMNTRRQVCVSGIFLVAITCVLTVILYLAESRVDPNFSFWDAFIWPYEKYLGDPGKVVDDPLMSPIGKLIGTLVGILGVAIFAVPAGLIGSGLTDAMDEEKHEKELDEYRARMRKSFRRTVDKTLRGYLNTLPDGGGEKLKALNFVPQRIPLSRIQIRQGIEMKDIFDICQKYPEFRLKNLAEAISDEEHPQDSFVVEHFPKNRPYGYAIDRKSKVTIVSTSSFSDNGTGWFTYYLAKLGGFNYISKDIEVDPDELDSFYNMSAESLYEKRPRSEYDEKKDKKAIEILNKKDANRQDFLDDLRDMATGEDSWVILFVAHIKSSMNTVDFHFASAKKDGSDSTVHQQEVYQALLEQLTDTLQKDYALTSDLHSQRFPLTKNNLGYRLQQKGIVCNAFVIRPSCEVINFDNRRLLIAYRIATVISRQLDGGRGIQPDDVKDFKETGFGYGLA